MKRSFLLMLILVLGLAACQPAATTSTAPVSQAPGATEAYAQTEPPGATAPAAETQAAPAAPAATQPVAAGPAVPPGCTVVSAEATPDPTLAAIFPAVDESDWVEGPSTAYVTMLEYSDFQ